MVTQQWTVNAIKDAVRASGSHWFDPDTMRFFGTRVLPTVYQGPGGVYFVTSEQPPHGPRKHSVRQFNPEDNDINTIGEVASMTKAQAVALARNKAAAGSVEQDATETAEPFRPVSTLQQFIDDLAAHGNAATAKADNAEQLILLAKQHHRYMEKLSSDEAFCRQLDAEGNHPKVMACRDHIALVARHVGAESVLFSGDPRGCTVKLTFADGFTNDFAHEGYRVPTE